MVGCRVRYCIKLWAWNVINGIKARFIRLAVFAGTIAGTARQQAEKFKWGLKPSPRMSIIFSRFQNVAEVADVAKDVEKERIDF